VESGEWKVESGGCLVESGDAADLAFIHFLYMHFQPMLYLCSSVKLEYTSVYNTAVLCAL
jgi:hypothetical protein